MNIIQKILLGLIVVMFANMVLKVYLQQKRIDKLEKMTDELIVLSNEVIDIANENQELAENWKLLYQLAEK